MSSTDDFQHYRFPKTLSEQRRFLGLPYDEAIPVLSALLGGVLMQKALFGLGLAVLLWLGLRSAKRGRGSMWLYNLFYWYLPARLLRGLFLTMLWQKTLLPDSGHRQWIK